VIPLLMIVFGYFVMKKFIFDLVDEVFDAGHALIIKNGVHEVRVPLSDIVNVSYSPFIHPPRVALLLRTPGIFGKQVTFCAPVRLVPFASSPVIDELIEKNRSRAECSMKSAGADTALHKPGDWPALRGRAFR
jgi:hypothetical protein